MSHLEGIAKLCISGLLARLIVELVNYFSDVVSIIVIIPIWKRVAGRQSIITPSSYVPKPPIRRSRFDNCQNKQTSAHKRRPPMAKIGSNFSATIRGLSDPQNIPIESSILILHSYVIVRR